MSPTARRAPAKRPRREPVVLRGTPRKLRVTIPVVGTEPLDLDGDIEATFKGAEVEWISIAEPRRNSLDDGPQIKLRLDPLTPPGRYEGTATVGKAKVPIVAEVEPRVAIQHDPPVVELTPDPAATLDVPITIRNTGNVPTDVPDASTFVLLDRSGFSDAFYRAIGEPPPDGKQRVDVLFDELAESTGGPVTVTVKRKGRWPLAPGATGTVTVSFAFTDQIRPGAQYAGAWDLDATHVPVRITVPIKETTPS